MNYRDGIRRRPIDDEKPLFIIKDLSKAKLISDKEGQAELINIENELYKVIKHYDKRKKTEIPKPKIMKEKNDKIENIVSNSINNNIIYINENNCTSKNDNSYILNYKLKEYQRPDNYIVYYSLKKNETDLRRKIYEADEADIIFLNIRNNFMSIEELENIIIDFENNAINDKDGNINEENARKIIEEKYSKYKNYMQCIINHFKYKRTTAKKSLIRTRWHFNKTTDKYLSNTFKRRESDKTKGRKNNQTIDESLSKIIDAEALCRNYILSVMKKLENKEICNKQLLQIDEYIFQTECDKIKKSELLENSIKDNNILIESIENNLKIIKENDFNIKKKSKENNQNNKRNIENVIINSNNSNNTKNSNLDDLNNKSTISINEDGINDNKNINDISTKGLSCYEKKDKKYQDHPKNNINKKNKELFPPLSLNLSNKNLSDNISNYLKNRHNHLRIKISLNKINKMTFDRYIDNSKDIYNLQNIYNGIISGHKKYDNNTFSYMNNNNYENLINSYNQDKPKNINILYDSEENSVDSTNDIKNFSNSYRQFLKSKRSNS